MQEIFGPGRLFSLGQYVFWDRELQIRFARGTLSLLAFQLTLLLQFLTRNQTQLETFLSENPSLFWFSLFLIVFSVLLIVFTQLFRRFFPLNLAALLIFSAFQGVLMTYFSMRFQTTILLKLLETSTHCVYLLAIFFLISRKFPDHDQIGPVLAVYSALNLFLLFIWGSISTAELLLRMIFGFLFSHYVLFELIRIVSCRRGPISTDDYVYAVLAIIIDPIGVILRGKRALE